MLNQKQISQIPFLAVLFAAAFIPFSKGGIETSILTGLVAFFLLKFKKKEFGITEIPLALPLLFYIIAIEISMFQNADLHITARGFIRIFKYLGLYWLVTESITTESRFKWLVRVIIVSSLLSCMNGFYQKATGWDFRHQYPILNNYGVLRISGSFNHPNNFAAYIITSVLIMLFATENRKWWRILSFVSILLSFAVLFETNSRMPLILLFVSLTIASIFSKKYRLYSFISIFIFAAISTIYFFYEPNYFARLLKVVLGDGRLQYWAFSIDIAKQSLWFGHGINSFMDVFGKYHMTSMYGDTRFVYAHNFILHMLVEIGIVGLFAFLNFLGQFFKKAVTYFNLCCEPLRKSIYGFLVTILFFLMHSTVDNNLQSLQLHTFFWILLGSVMGMAKSKKPPF